MERINAGEPRTHEFFKIFFDAFSERFRINVHHNKTREQKKEIYPQIAFLDKMVKRAVPGRQRKAEDIEMKKNNQNRGQTAQSCD